MAQGSFDVQLSLAGLSISRLIVTNSKPARKSVFQTARERKHAKETVREAILMCEFLDVLFE